MSFKRKIIHIYRKVSYSLLPEKEYKYFCIGLHKTGTTSIHRFAQKNGFKAFHSTDWCNNQEQLNAYNFLSDGGSHFEGQKEFPIEKLYHDFPNSRFILQTRNTRSWLISKCKHGGWTKDSVLEPDDEKMIRHELWRYKSKLTLKELVNHKTSYETRVRAFFKKHDSSRFLEINIVDNETRSEDVLKVCDFLLIDRSKAKHFLPKNKSKSDVTLSDEVMEFINSITE
jgi:hypothetical protein